MARTCPTVSWQSKLQQNASLSESQLTEHFRSKLPGGINEKAEKLAWKSISDELEKIAPGCVREAFA